MLDNPINSIFTLSTTSFKTLYTYTNHTNIPSTRVAEKNGMKLVEEYKDGEEILKVYSITKDEYLNNI